MKNNECENLNEAFAKSDIIILYNENIERCIKISYQCFLGKEWQKSGIDLKEIIYSNQEVPKDYMGSIFSIKSSICNDEISYESMDISNGKIKGYGFQLYNSEDKNKFLGKVHSDISKILLDNYNLEKCIKYKSLYNKKKFGKIVLSLNNNSKLIDLIVDDNKFYPESVIENIVDYEAVLLKFEILNKSLT